MTGAVAGFRSVAVRLGRQVTAARDDEGAKVAITATSRDARPLNGQLHMAAVAFAQPVLR